MRWKHLSELIKVNLIYSNPQVVDKKRKQEAEGKGSRLSVPMTVISQSALLLFLFGLIYSMMISSIDFVSYPGYFTFYTLTFISMAMLHGFYIIYNLLYESKDLQHYLPLPFTGAEIFLAKIVVIIITVIPYMVPSFTVFFNLGVDAGRSILMNILLSFVTFILTFAVVLLVAISFIHLISQLSIFQKHKKIMITGLYTISTLGMVAAILILSNSSTEAMAFGIVMPDYPVIPFLHYLHVILLDPTSSAGLIGSGAWMLLLVLLLLFVYKVVIPSVYASQEEIRTPSKVTKKAKPINEEAKTIKQILLKYNFNLIQENTLIMQYMSANIIIPIMMLGSLMTNSFDLSGLDVNLWWGVLFFVGFLYAFMTLSPMSIVGVIISLDRNNFLFIKSLPFSLVFYLKSKFWFAVVIQLILPLIISTGLMLWIKLPVVLIVLFLLGLFVGVYFLSERYFIKDYRSLNLDWQNITELFTRGGSNFLQGIRIFVTLFAGVLLVVGAVFLMSALSGWGRILLSIALIAAPLGLTVAFAIRNKRQFWAEFD